MGFCTKTTRTRTGKVVNGMLSFFRKPFRYALVFTTILSLCTTFILLDTFVIPRADMSVESILLPSSSTSTTGATTNTENEPSESENEYDSTAHTDETSPNGETESTTTTTTTATATSNPVVTENSYQDTNIQITIDTLRKYDTTIYIADIQIKSTDYLKTALAKNTYGRNIKQTTSAMAEEHNAIFAINGDYYGFRNAGYVLRNGVLYRDTTRSSSSDDVLVIDKNGDFSVIDENQTAAQALRDVWQMFSFGPALIRDGSVAVTTNSEVGQSMNSNPRTAIGQISKLHYLVVVSDGRTSESAGLSLIELASVFADRGCKTAYNLDGGGSSTMWFLGNVINNPTDGRSSSERSVSDIVYIGYE